MDRNPQITAHEREVLHDPAERNALFSKSSAAVIDGSGKRNGWLNVELQSADIIERCSKKIQPQVSFCMCVFYFCLFVFWGEEGFNIGLTGPPPPPPPVPLFF